MSSPPEQSGASLSDLPLPPGSLGLPFVGETLNFLRDPNFAQKRFKQFGSIFKTHLIGKPTVFVRGSEINQFVLTHENDYFVSSWPPSVEALLGPDSLSLQMGRVHQQRRKLLAQAFMPRALADYIPTMETLLQSYLQTWKSTDPLTWYPELRKYTFDVACKLLVGLEHGSQTPLGHYFETWCEGLFSLPFDLPWTQFGKAKKSRLQILTTIDQLITQRQQESTPGTDVLGRLLQAEDEAGNRLPQSELKDQILTLLFAGHETLTSALASFCLLTAQHPQVLAQIRAEQQQYDPEVPLTLDLLKQMTYLEQVLKEVLRFVPPVGGGFREVVQDCTVSGYRIPKGWSVGYQIASTHSLDQEYVSPESFDPDRFSPERQNEQAKYAYIPFGGGVRECLGKEFARLEMKIFAVHLAREYTWTLVPGQDLEMSMIPTPRPKDNLMVKLQRL